MKLNKSFQAFLAVCSNFRMLTNNAVDVHIHKQYTICCVCLLNCIARYTNSPWDKCHMYMHVKVTY